MAIGNILLLFFLITLFVYAQNPDKNPNNYGPYNMKYLEYNECKGPKPRNATILSTNLFENGTGYTNLTFLADTKLEEVRISVYNIVEDKKSFLWSYKITNPCKHYSMYLLIKSILKSENCNIKKGSYPSVINYKDVTMALIGPSFYYGNYSFQSRIMSKTANIACITSTLNLSKKTES